VGVLGGEGLLGALAVGYAGKVLADLGAEVTAVEAEGGDPVRALGTAEGLFRHLHAATAWADELPEVDVLLEGLGPGGLEAAGIAPRGAVVRVSPFGQTGPRAAEPATDLTVQAAGGWVYNHGIPGLDPVRVGAHAPAYVAGAYAAAAALTAHRTARATGEPVIVDLSVQACLIGTLPYPMLFQFTLDRMGQVFAERRFVVPGIVPCADGWVGINCLTGQHWLDLCELLEVPDWSPRQREVIEPGDAYDRFLAATRPWLEARPAEEIVEIAQALRIPCAPIGDGASLPGLAQFAARGFYRPLDGDGPLVPGPAARLAEPAPLAAQPDPGPPTERPFTGLRVVDLSIFWSAPYLSMYLGSLGADVVKVESLQRVDGFRFSASFPELGEDWYERSLVWQATNLSKRDITLDLTRPEGQDLLWRLLDGADVLVENFAPRVAESFGLTEASVRERWPGLVYLRMPGFGLEGPWRDHVGWAMVFEQACGLAQVTGPADGPPLNPGGFADPVVGMHAAAALQAALGHRDRTGRGQVIEVAQVEVMAALTAEQVLEGQLGGRAPGRTGNQSAEAAVEEVVPDGDGWVARSMSADGEVLASSPVLTVPGMLGEPQLAARGYYQELPHPLTGTVPYPGWPMSFSAGVPRHHRFGAPTLGQHNDDVLGGELGLSAEELAELRAAKIIGEAL
jgi:crotonobetainyl-CoA:carnitine CoA-transferase CaiB-like acyl-CoA transferase